MQDIYNMSTLGRFHTWREYENVQKDFLSPHDIKDLIGGKVNSYLGRLAATHWYLSGKFLALNNLLTTWGAKKHKVLLFTQTKKVLSIVEEFAKMNGFTYLRMDGSVNLKARSKLIDNFNTNPDIFLFLLTTKVHNIYIYIYIGCRSWDQFIRS